MRLGVSRLSTALTMATGCSGHSWAQPNTAQHGFGMSNARIDSACFCMSLAMRRTVIPARISRRSTASALNVRCPVDHALLPDNSPISHPHHRLRSPWSEAQVGTNQKMVTDLPFLPQPVGLAIRRSEAVVEAMRPAVQPPAQQSRTHSLLQPSQPRRRLRRHLQWSLLPDHPQKNVPLLPRQRIHQRLPSRRLSVSRKMLLWLC